VRVLEFECVCLLSLISIHTLEQLHMNHGLIKVLFSISFDYHQSSYYHMSIPLFSYAAGSTREK
jgi:hypothetical protein